MTSKAPNPPSPSRLAQTGLKKRGGVNPLPSPTNLRPPPPPPPPLPPPKNGGKLKPCPNPECVFPYPRIRPTVNGYAREVYCSQCGMTGPVSANDAATLWDALPRASDLKEGVWRMGEPPLRAGPLLADTRADCFVDAGTLRVLKWGRCHAGVSTWVDIWTDDVIEGNMIIRYFPINLLKQGT